MRPDLLTTNEEAVAAWLHAAAREKKHGIGREIPREELQRFTPELAQPLAAFEPAEHHLFGAVPEGATESKPAERGVHGLWPGRKDYSAYFLLWGKGIKPARKPRASMLTIAPRLAELLGVKYPFD